MTKKSDTLKQREKAQKDLLELKKMQQGLIYSPKEEKDVKTPQTFKEKKENFFYHYKAVFIGVIAIVVIITFAVFDMVTKTKYDNTPVLFTYEYYSSPYVKEIEETLEIYCEDIDGNGEISVSVLDCSFNLASTGYEYQKNQRSKLQARIASGQTMLFLLDESSLADLKNNLEYELFLEENIVDITPLLEEGFLEIESQSQNGETKMPKGKLLLCLREIEGSTAEKNQTEYDAAKNLIEKVKAKIK